LRPCGDFRAIASDKRRHGGGSQPFSVTGSQYPPLLANSSTVARQNGVMARW